MINIQWRLKNAKCREGADIEERLLEFAVRVGKAIDPLLDRRLGRHIAGQLAKPKSSIKEINHELPANPGCKEKMSNRDLQVQNAATTSKHFAISNLHYSLIISFRATSPH
jgi:hypothetical protein